MRQSPPDFQEILHSNILKATPIRIELLRTLWSLDRPRTVDEIARQLDLDVVTVYRNLNNFVQKGLAIRGIGAAGIEGDMRGDIRAAHFSYAKKDHHHHLACTDCGFIKSCNTCV